MSSIKNIVGGAAVLATLFNPASAHMKISSPVPYGQDSLDNSPLKDAGTDYPCKQRTGVYDMPATGYNQMAAGSSQKLAFIGGATHSGGSCQVSVTMDKEPTTESQWKVIHSIVGGCPSDADGNLSESASGTGASQFNFTIPDSLPNGQYTLAWTWFNKVGNREMYMNCAPIEVSGGADGTTELDSLPDMFVANIPAESCAIPESSNWVFPDPGNSVETAGQAPFASTFAVNSGCASVTAKGKGAGTLGSPASATGGADSGSGNGSASAPAVSSASPTSAAGGYGSASGGVPIGTGSAGLGAGNGVGASPTATSFQTVVATTTAAAETSAPAASAPAGTSAAASPVGTGTAGSGTSSDGTCTNGAVACSDEGAIVCMSDSQFGLCNFGCAVPQAVAGGMQCSGGTMEAVAVNGSKARRGHIVRKHVHPHAKRYTL